LHNLVTNFESFSKL